MTYTHLEWLIICIICLLIAAFTAHYARREGKNPYLWFVFGFVFGLMAPLILFLSTIIKRWQDREKIPGATHTKLDSSLKNDSKSPSIVGLNIESEENKLWYYLNENHEQMGPVSIIALRELWNRGQLQLKSYVWSEGMGEWQRVDNLPDLKAALNKPEATI